MDMERLHIFAFLNVFVFAIFGTVSSQTYENATRLRSDLLANYHKDVRPINNQSDVVNVNVTLDLFGIPEIDDVRGVITITVATQCVWIDERMQWDPADYGGISKILILTSEAWTPSISLGTPIEFATMGSVNNHVIFFPSGFALFYPGAVLKSSCGFNMKFWPFDKQICDVGFFPLDYTTDQLLFTIIDGVKTKSFTPNAEWVLEDTSYYTINTVGFSMAIFRFKLKRQSLFYVLTIILPINGIAGLTCLVFLLPSESGERVSYAITIMLSLAVFLTVVSDEMPKSSEPISLMCCYILAGICVSVIGTVLAILNLAVYHRKENVPKKPWHISLVMFSKCTRNNKVSDEQDRNNGIQDIKYGNAPTHDKTKATKTHILKVNQDEDKDADGQTITWQDVSLAIDKLLFYAMVFLTYIPSIGFLIYLGAASDYQM
ncbi:neuronal acetylcholine receptor subunit beta-3-like [Ruditapes philippinarum]|uniref:neuronal acetylcholine receptor subunit beta-3-like n=1 Tax=Ruditapes philippinarum TaxID=129788 RepID=UPI00295C1AE5|nr:neuronal acetylcholine receptor subunit beta-3-like [Ruditapes philippinarum]